MFHNLSCSFSFHMEWLADSLEDFLRAPPGELSLQTIHPELQRGGLPRHSPGELAWRCGPLASVSPCRGKQEGSTGVMRLDGFQW